MSEPAEYEIAHLSWTSMYRREIKLGWRLIDGRVWMMTPTQSLAAMPNRTEEVRRAIHTAVWYRITPRPGCPAKCWPCNPRGNPKPIPHARGYHAKTRRRRSR